MALGALEIAGFKLRIMDNGNVWIESPEGEGGEFSVEVVADAIDRVFADFF